MFKKLAFGFVVIVTLIFLAVGSYVWQLIEEKPKDIPTFNTVTYGKAFAAKNEQTKAWLLSIYHNTQIPSFSAAISVKGKIAWAGAIGYRDFKNKTLADINTQYRIGSVSKSLTSAALMKLNQQKTLNINHSFYHYVKNFPEKSSVFTLKQLASHQAGIRHYKQGVDSLFENFNNTEYSTTRKAAAVIENDDLLYKPSTSFIYSTYGYTLLALAMESAANKPFEDIMHHQVFDLLNFKATVFEKNTKQQPAKAKPYIATEYGLLSAPDVNLSYKYAGGGYLSTPSDLIKFGNALLGNEFLSSASKKEMWTAIALDNGMMNPEYYGLGFRVGEDDLGKFVHHGGKSVGGYSYFVIYPELEFVVALSINVTPMGFVYDRHKEARKLIDIFN